MFDRPLRTRDLLIAIAISGLAIRLFLAAYTTMPYDMSFWAGVMNGFNMGEGLYESEYFWYTPTWGYILSFLTHVMNILGVNIQGFIVTDINDGVISYVYSAITDPAFNLIVKLPLILSDILIAILMFRLVLMVTGNDRKATLASGMWFLCPLVIWNGSVQGQFDTLAILGMILSIVLVMKERYALAGAAIVFASITKMFPAILIPLLVGYAIAKSDGVRDCTINLGKSIFGGAVMALFIFLPVILTGDLGNSFLFLTDRVTNYSEGTAMDFFLPLWGNIFTLAPIIIVAIIILTIFVARNKTDLDRRFLLYSTVATCLLFLWPNAPPYSQYVLLMLPFLIILNFDGYDMRIPYILTSVMFTTSVLVLTGPASLYPLSFGLGVISPDTISHSIMGFESTIGWVYDIIESFKFVPALVAVSIIAMKHYKINRRCADEIPL